MSLAWPKLRLLRESFLKQEPLPKDYWKDPDVLEGYDQTFGARIGWKWAAVLAELGDLGWVPPEGARLLDWGCGTGVASRMFARQFPGRLGAAALFDRSPEAMRFAQTALLSEKTVASVATTKAPFAEPSDVVLLSHVMTELTDEMLAGLLPSLQKARTVIWVEQGTPLASRRLLKARETLRETFHPWAPCPHNALCGMVDPENARHWCHHFADVPGEVSRSAFWREAQKELGIDLRSLPLSYLVMSKDPAPERLPRRVIGRPRTYKGYLMMLVCQEEGVKEERLQKRDDKALFKRLEDAGFRETLT